MMMLESVMEFDDDAGMEFDGEIMLLCILQRQMSGDSHRACINYERGSLKGKIKLET
jgi:hypothetical protein